jgi:CDP-diacylglycerol--glycerol-3-phosphate 3-phosphatidyltransferase
MKRNIPNILTVSRIIAVLVFVILAAIADHTVIRDRNYVTILRWVAYILATVAGLTDLFDGYLARRFKAVSDFGALMDPLADKIFVTATMLMAVEYRLMPAWIAVAVLCREFMVTGLRTLAAKRQVVLSADRWGKLKTALQMVMLAIAGFAWAIDGGPEYLREAEWLGMRIWYIWSAYLIGIVLVTVLSGLNYFVKYRYLFMKENSVTEA